MTYDEWASIYGRLTKTFNKPIVGEQCAAYFEVLQQYPTTCVQQAAQQAIRTSKHWPSAAELVETAREERSRLTTHAHGDDRNSCQDCHGDLWVPGPPLHFNGSSYESVQRCPRCRPARTA